MTDIFELLKGKKSEKQSVIVQGITGKFGTRHTKLMLEYGTNIVAGVTPGKGGQKFEDSVPIYETVKEAVDATGAKISIMFVPAKFFLGAAKDALEAGIKLLIAIPEHVPVQDAMKTVEIAKQKGAIVIGPNTPGVMIPGLIKIGIMPASPFKFGNTAVLSKSATLLYEIGNNLSSSGFGQCITIGIGGDPISGTSFIDCVDLFLKDPETKSILLIGEIGGTAEEEAAEFLKNHTIKKPVVGFVAGITAPPGRRMGHAGAIITRGKGGAEEKIKIMQSCGITIAKSPAEIGHTLLHKLHN